MGFLKESPEDPERYREDAEDQDFPSFFAWPEWKDFCRAYNLFEIGLDQGPLGHEIRKPTRLGTNLALLRELEGLRGWGVGGTGSDGDGIKGRIQRSKKWAAWALKLKERIVEAVVAKHKNLLMRKMSEAQWQQHLNNDHLLFSRECVHYQVGAGRSRPHRRVHDPDTYTLSVDLCGPFHQGKDYMCKKGKYIVAGVFTIPTTESGEKPCPLPPGYEDLFLQRSWKTL